MKIGLKLIGLCLGIGLSAGCGQRGAPGVDGGPPRIVSLAPSITEIICAIGAEALLAGRSSACNFPPDKVALIPVVGDFGVPSTEMLIKVDADVVLTTDLADESMKQRIEAIGLDFQRLQCKRLADIPRFIRQIGAICNRAEAAEQLALKIESGIEAARAAQPPPDQRPLVYAEIWHDPLTTAGRDTFLSDLISVAGGSNLGDKVSREYFQISSEQILADNPAVILCLYMASSRGAARLVKARPGWRHITAVQRDAVYDGLDNDVLLRPGPRVLDGLDALRRCITGAGDE